MSKPFVDLDNARVEEQRRIMEQILAAGHCPFCRENLELYNKTQILKEGKHWIIVPNQWPYENTSLHLMFVLKTHVEELALLDPQAGAELIELSQWAQQEYQIPGGGIAMRFGDTEYSAGTITHIHAHLIQPNIDAPNYDAKPVKFKIGKTGRQPKTQS